MIYYYLEEQQLKN